MSKVLIIKDNNSVKKIHEFAQKSFDTGKKGFYNVLENTSNYRAVSEIKRKFKGDGIVLMISYENANETEIKDIFIGSNVNILDNNTIEYVMKIHLYKELHSRAIHSIIDKIDLDINRDFERECYVIMSEMESLFKELNERVIAVSRNNSLMLTQSKINCKNEYKLSNLAQRENQSIRVYSSSNVGDFRTEFQRDRERVVNCKAFRRMVDKAQIFSSEKGDYYRTRMTHSLEVNQIAKAISYALNLNLDLTEAIALGHDIGHTPFGHQGERTLDDILNGKIDIGIKAYPEMFENRCFGGFKHNYQSAKMLTQLEEKYVEFSGLNVSIQVVEGVLKHTKFNPDIEIGDFIPKEYMKNIHILQDSKEQICSSLEGQVVTIADEIAQRGHDVDDALTSGVMTVDEFKDRLETKKCETLKKRIYAEIDTIKKSNRLLTDEKELTIARIVSCIINYFIESTIEQSTININRNSEIKEISFSNSIKLIDFTPEVKKVNSYLENVVQKKVICNSEVARADYNAGVIVKTLFEKYYKNPRLLHSGTIHKIFVEMLKHKNLEVANSAINLSDTRTRLVNAEIDELTKGAFEKDVIMAYIKNNDSVDNTKRDVVIYEKVRILVRAITDYIAGMTDAYAMAEYEKLK